MNHTIIRLLAILITLTAILMTSIAALNRGGTFIEQILLVSLSIIMVLAVHFLPAISRSASAWILWTGCLLCAIFGHLTFLTHSTISAGEVRVLHSAQMIATQNQIAATRGALEAISARPVTVIAAELGQAVKWREIVALREELKQARQADLLRNELVRLSAVTTATVTNATDPVTNRVAAITGISEASITIGVGMLFSVLLELTGAFLWFEALKQDSGGGIQDEGRMQDGGDLALSVVTMGVTTRTTTHVTQVTDTVSQLRRDILTGQCRPTVAAIRNHLHCSQVKAMALRREIMST